MPNNPTNTGKVGWLSALSPRYLVRPSVLVLIAANLVPLFGVLFWGWDLFVLMMAYWMETGVIGFWSILHMAIVARWRALLLAPFFIVHFGGFMAGHFLFLWTLFGREQFAQVGTVMDFFRIGVWETGLLLALIAMVVSHGFSFFFNVWRRMRDGRAAAGANPSGVPATRAKDAGSIMGATYGRVVLMHITILFGAMLAAIFQTKTAAFVLLIVLKVAADIAAHVRKNFAPQAASGG